MSFGESKCAYLRIEKGKMKQTTQHLEMNVLKIQTSKERESYIYLDQDENVSYNGPVNQYIKDCEAGAGRTPSVRRRK